MTGLDPAYWLIALAFCVLMISVGLALSTAVLPYEETPRTKRPMRRVSMPRVRG